MKVITMRIQEFPKKMYAGLFVVLLMFAVSCDGVISNFDNDSTSPSASYGTIDGLNFGGWGEEEYYEVCETAFAFGGDFGNCFLDNEDLRANRWGWSNGPLPENEETYEFPIYTGAAQCDITKGTHVGTLKVDYIDGKVTVTYELFDDFYMTEVHIYVGNEELPKDRRGRSTVAPGQYTYTNDMVDNLSSYPPKTFEGFEGDIYVIAHAVVCEGCEPLNVIYGTVGDGKNGSLWQITVSGGTIIEETELISFTLDGDQYSPNGLALDKENNRLYYAINDGNDNADLYYYDFGGNDPDLNLHEVATDLRGHIYAATWGAGLYWYIPNGSSDMRTVDVTTGDASDFELNFTGEGKSFNFGDMALDVENLTIYSSTSFSGTHKEFFKYDLTIASDDPGYNLGDRYDMIVEYEGVPADDAGKAIGLQLAFDAEGNLFGHSTFGQTQTGAEEREFFLVDKEMGFVNPLPYISENQYNDLASGRFIFLCKETEENEY